MKRWFRILKDEVEQSLNIQFKLFVSEHEINENVVTLNYIKKWVRSVKQLKINVKKHKCDEICRFIINKQKNQKKKKNKNNEIEIESEIENKIDEYDIEN